MDRFIFCEKISHAFTVNPIVAVLGPRQCGKTTLARHFAKQQPFNPENYFDLEDPIDLARLENPRLALASLKGLIIIDEVQRSPEIFPILRVLVDKENFAGQFLILGSASRHLLQQSSETLAGRISHIELTPFSYMETHELMSLWDRGGFPKSYLAQTELQSSQWRKEYIRTFLAYDLPNLGFNIPAQNLGRFWMMLAHYHGNIFNASEIGRSLQLPYKTAQQYIDILSGTFMVRQLQPWHENIGKRQIKSSKIYFRDSGLYHTLLNIDSFSQLQRHPKLGASWEGFALEEVIRWLDLTTENCFFWSTHQEAELDLLVFYKNQRLGFEFKYSDAPRLTKSMKIAYEDLKLDQLYVIYPGEKDYKLHSDWAIKVMGLKNFLNSHLITP